nr:hypothetical protein [uncultured Allomuricauda sp.]
MKINKKIKNILFFLLGLISFPILTSVYLEIFPKPTVSEGDFYNRILMSPTIMNLEKAREYKFEGNGALIISDSLDFLKYDSFPFNASKQEFIGLDLRNFDSNDRDYYSSLFNSSFAFSGAVTESDRIDYLEYIRKFKPRGKCVSPNNSLSENQYILDVEIKGEKLLLPSFEFGDHNYTNPGCFKENASGYTLNNVVSIDNLNLKIPFKVQIISDGKENNSYKFKLELKTKNGKSLYKYPKTKEFSEGKIENLATTISIEKAFSLKSNEEELAK